MTQNRKRSRSHHEDEMEFMPLSKRINNLHINNGMLLDQSVGPLGAEWGPGPPYGSQPESPPESASNLNWGAAGALPSPATYSPELSETENPYYFSINKLLFEMYLARSQRSGN